MALGTRAKFVVVKLELRLERRVVIMVLSMQIGFIQLSVRFVAKQSPG